MADFKRMRNNMLRSVKERMISGNYDDIVRLNSVRSASDIVVIANRCLSAEDIYRYYETVAAIQSSGDDRCLSAVGSLVDSRVYDSLSEEQRERYILSLAAFYKDLREEYLRRREASATELGTSGVPKPDRADKNNNKNIK